MTLVNVYPIENLSSLKCAYRLHRVRGIGRLHDGYEADARRLCTALGRLTCSPCEPVRDRNGRGGLLVAQPADSKPLPSEFDMGGSGRVLIEPVGGEKVIDFARMGADDEHLAARFVKFYADGSLCRDGRLWTTGSGGPFYQKKPDGPPGAKPAVESYTGIRYSPMAAQGGRMGICADVTTAYAEGRTLDARLTEAQFDEVRGRHCICEYAHTWYAVRIEGLGDLSVSETQISGTGMSLFDHLHKRAGGRVPPTLRDLPPDGAVITCKTAAGETRSVPAGLCRLVPDQRGHGIGPARSSGIGSPSARKEAIDFMVGTYLSSIPFGGSTIRLSGSMLGVDVRRLEPPDLRFGRGRALSVRGTAGAVQEPLADIGRAKQRMLHSAAAGYFSQKALDRQYLMLPASAYNEYGGQYISDVKAEFRRTYSPSGEFRYDPIVVSYDDGSGDGGASKGDDRDRAHALGRSVAKTARAECRPGYALVVIPRLGQARAGGEDLLASIVTEKLRGRGMRPSIAHTDAPSRHYRGARAGGRPSARHGAYMANLVLNKILLLNSCWPFVLDAPLNADMTVGIDVRDDAAGFAIAMGDGRTYGFYASRSSQGEKLGRRHLAHVLRRILGGELRGAGGSNGGGGGGGGGGDAPRPIRNVVVHRNGTAFDSELDGIADALDALAGEGAVDPGYDCNVVEIARTTAAPARLFDESPAGAIGNPLIGTYMASGDSAVLCTTGPPYERAGTPRPIRATRVRGGMDFGLVLEDLFALASLTWTRIDDCSRLPITIKMADMRLREVAGRYDRDAFEFGGDEQ